MADGVKVICVGDHIECINGKNIVGTRHYEVARMLKDLPKNQTFKLKLLEPMKAFGEGLFLKWCDNHFPTEKASGFINQL